MVSPNNIDSYDDVLMERLNFDSLDLDANRGGMLTGRQKRRVWRWQLGWSVAMWGSALFVVWLGQTDFLRDTGTTGRMVWFAALAALILGAFWFQSRTFRILASGTAHSTTGPIRRSAGYSKSDVYSISTPEKEFTVSADVHRIFCDGQDYTLYYVPEMNYLLSADFHPAPEVDYAFSTATESQPVPYPVVMESQAPLLEQLNHVLQTKQSSMAESAITISQTPLLHQVNHLFSIKQEAPKKKPRKKKGH